MSRQTGDDEDLTAASVAYSSRQSARPSRQIEEAERLIVEASERVRGLLDELAAEPLAERD